VDIVGVAGSIPAAPTIQFIDDLRRTTRAAVLVRSQIRPGRPWGTRRPDFTRILRWSGHRPSAERQRPRRAAALFFIVDAIPDQADFFRRAKPSPARPSPNRASVPGSGTAAVAWTK